MYITNYEPGYFDCVAALEAKVYPPPLRFNPDVMREELEQGKYRSLLAFENGELVGYIIAYPMPENYQVCYISDLNCTNKRALWHLLSCFFLSKHTKASCYEAVCRPASFKLLHNSKFRDAITLIRQDKTEDYYAPGEDAYAVSFHVDKDAITDWKMEFIHFINESDRTINLDDVFDFFNRNHVSISEIERGKDFILRAVNERHLSMYRMLSENVPVFVNTIQHFGASYAAKA